MPSNEPQYTVEVHATAKATFFDRWSTEPLTSPTMDDCYQEDAEVTIAEPKPIDEAAPTYWEMPLILETLDENSQGCIRAEIRGVIPVHRDRYGRDRYIADEAFPRGLAVECFETAVNELLGKVLRAKARQHTWSVVFPCANK